MATEYGIKFMETSAKSSINVEEVILSFIIITVMSKGSKTQIIHEMISTPTVSQ